MFQKESPLDAHLHIAALQGDVDTLRRVLDSGRVHVDCKDRVSSDKNRKKVRNKSSVAQCQA